MSTAKESIADLIESASGYIELNQLERAKECLDKILKRKPRHIQALKELAIILVSQGQLDKAASYFRIIIEDKPDDIIALNELGLIHKKQGNYRKAVEIFRRLLEITPNNLHVLGELGLMHNWLSEVDKANSCFEKISRISRGMLTEKLKNSQTLRKSEEELIKKSVYLLASGRITTVNAMATCFAHQINTPLQVIQGVIFSLLGKQEIDQENVREGLVKIQYHADLINEFTRHLSKLIKDESGGHRLIKISEVILGAFSLFEQQLNHREILVDLSEIENDEGKSFVLGNRIELEHVFINLIANARDALEFTERPEIKVGLRAEENNMVVSFCDNGAGISKENLDRIFDSLFTTKPKGTGLGLWLCYSVIHDMNGKIQVESDLGEGTKFTIFLPSKGRNHGAP